MKPCMHKVLDGLFISDVEAASKKELLLANVRFGVRNRRKSHTSSSSRPVSRLTSPQYHHLTIA